MNSKKILLSLSITINLFFISIFIYKIYYRWNPKPKENVINLTSWQDKFSEFKILNQHIKGNIIFLGASSVERFNLIEFFPDKKILNRGIGHDDTKSLLVRLPDNVLNARPKKIFILIGTNDILHKIPGSETISNLEKIYKKIIDNNITLVVISLLPVWNTSEIKNSEILYLNKQILKLCKKFNIKYFYIYDKFINNEKELRRDLSSDGIHLNAKGYLLFAGYIKPLI